MLTPQNAVASTGDLQTQETSEVRNDDVLDYLARMVDRA
jgi:hypothetical protein